MEDIARCAILFLDVVKPSQYFVEKSQFHYDFDETGTVTDAYYYQLWISGLTVPLAMREGLDVHDVVEDMLTIVHAYAAWTGVTVYFQLHVEHGDQVVESRDNPSRAEMETLMLHLPCADDSK